MGNILHTSKLRFVRLKHSVAMHLPHPHKKNKHMRSFVVNLASTNLNSKDMDLELLQPQTHFSPIELKVLKLQYNALCGERHTTLVDKEIAKDLFFRTQRRDPNFIFSEPYEFLLTVLFNAMNTDGDGYLSFPEYATALSKAAHGSWKEKAWLSFRIYDYNGDGAVEQQELIQFINVLTKLQIIKDGMILESSETRGDAEMKYMEQLSEVDRGLSSPTNLNGQSQPDEPKVAFTSESGAYYQMISHLHQSTAPDSYSGVPSMQTVFHENEVAALVNNFFGGKDRLTYEEYEERSRSVKYMLECFGLFDYCLMTILKPLHLFLSNPNRYEINCQVNCNGHDLLVEIRGGVLYNYMPVTHKLIRIIHLNEIDSIELTGTGFDFIIYWKNTTLHYHYDSSQLMVRNLFAIALYNIETIDNRYDSFAAVKPGCKFLPLVDGKDTYAAMARALMASKQQILIAGWCFNPFIYMIRDMNIDQDYRLDKILLTQAQKGVKIYIIIWHELSMAGMGLGTNQIQKYLNTLHPNIMCILHPNGRIFQWTHHQKLMVIDQLIAFIGGLDVGHGRYDCKHELTDANRLHAVWPGEDYANDTLPRNLITASGPLKYKAKALHDGLDRDLFPRLPWHDIHCVLAGSVARDIASNFISRWNTYNKISAERINNSVEEEKVYDIVLHLNPYDEQSLTHISEYVPDGHLGDVRVQVVRSMSGWSGSQRTEKSIQTAYCQIIRSAENYIYIENQYFMSKTPRSSKVENLIGQAIIDRIGRAITEKRVFRVIVMLPMHHSGDIYDSSTHQVMKWQRRTILGVFEELQKLYPHANINDYISFFSLANYGFLDGVPHFSQVYIHSKLMIVDDKIAVIGSANINDRSMVGNHDSEIAVVIEDDSSSQTLMNGKLQRSGKSIKQMRKKLWREHWNPTLSNRKFLSGWQLQASKDPVSDFIYHFMQNRARENTAIYESLFIHYPCKRHRLLPDYKKDLETYLHMAAAKTVRADDEMRNKLSNIQGLVVQYPLDWLAEDPFTKDTKLKILDDNLFF
jgi:phosphatidylserine/phosphatidylglycerophosphate/cardiolipin synthase-like enzyme/Ca2+-binding EF-hand superfamily protein